jgi:alpha-beta hydrolase superfamily lysophospholipase
MKQNIAPIGYFAFHKQAFFNYQLNRWYSLGFTRKDEIETVGRHAKMAADFVSAFTQLSKNAEMEDRLSHAAFYARAAEFLASVGSPEKTKLSQRFLDLYDLAFPEVERHLVPYGDSHLSALRLAPKGKPKGSVLAIGGFDSMIEEFTILWAILAEAGYEVIAFEGPGQGATRRLQGVLFDHHYEKPAGVVLDHFSLETVAMMGVSMGGYWAMRAAAFEPRITRVIAMPPLLDWMQMTNGLFRWLVPVMMKVEGMMNWMVKLKMSVPAIGHTMQHAMYISGGKRPINAVKWMLEMNADNLHSERITQDVLLLAGENDAFQPVKLMHLQKTALINARSIETRVFTKEENADQHCQIGNLGLVMQVAIDWLDRKMID